MKRFGSVCAALLLILGVAVSFAEPVRGAAEEPVRIAVIDTGISSAAIAAEHLAEGRNYLFPARSAEDTHGHGTAVAGIMAGSDKAGVKGVSPRAALIPLVYHSSFGDEYAVRGGVDLLAKIIRDAVDVHQARVINISSGAGADSSALRDAVAWAERHGALVVASAGNDGNGTVNYPCAYSTVVCVGSVNETADGPASFSNRYDGVDLLAPGIRVRTINLDGEAVYATGTSFSAAWVSGAAAAILEAESTLTPYQVRKLLYQTARDIGPSGYDADSGWGIADLGAAMAQLEEERGRPFPFRDVPQDAEYRDAVVWALNRGVTGGTSASAFSPGMTVTRAQALTFIWRAAGSPEPRLAGNPFEDVKDNDYFYKAVLWGIEKGVTSGTSNIAFSPHERCSEAEVITFLWRALGPPDASGRSGQAAGPGDSFYTDAAAWADTRGLFAAVRTAFDPKREATRAHIVVYLYQSIGAASP